MNSRIARKKLHLSKRYDPNFISAEYNHLNIKAARYLGVWDKILWIYPLRPKPVKIHVSWEKLSDPYPSFQIDIKEKLVDVKQ